MGMRPLGDDPPWPAPAHQGVRVSVSDALADMSSEQLMMLALAKRNEEKLQTASSERVA